MEAAIQNHPFKLSEDTEKRLNQLERIIERGQKTFVEVGSALTIIRDEKLYRHAFSTFEDYCKERWGFTRMRASQLIASAKVVANVNNCLQKPTHESQTRPLARLEPEQQTEAWKKAVETAPEGRLTAKHVETVVAEMIEPEIDEEAGEIQEVEIEDTPALKQLKKYWEMADQHEKELFLEYLKEKREL